MVLLAQHQHHNSKQQRYNQQLLPNKTTTVIKPYNHNDCSRLSVTQSRECFAINTLGKYMGPQSITPLQMRVAHFIHSSSVTDDLTHKDWQTETHTWAHTRARARAHIHTCTQALTYNQKFTLTPARVRMYILTLLRCYTGKGYKNGFCHMHIHISRR